MARTELTEDIVLRVDPGGDDQSGNGTDNNPFKTPQGAWDFLSGGHDLKGRGATILLTAGGPGTEIFYPGLRCSGRIPGQIGCAPPLQVNPGRPSYQIGKLAPIKLRSTNPTYYPGAILYPPADSGIPALSLSEGAALDVAGVTFDSSRAGSDCVDVFYSALLVLKNCRFGAAAPWANHISVYDAVILQDGGYQVSGQGFYHINIGHGGSILVNNNGDPALGYVVEFLGPQIFNPQAAFVLVDGGTYYAMCLSWAGAGHGPGLHVGLTANVIRSGAIETGSGGNPNYFPGTLPPSVDGSSYYA